MDRDTYRPGLGVKFIFSPEIVSAFEAIAWWEWPVEKITQNLAIIVPADINALRACANQDREKIEP